MKRGLILDLDNTLYSWVDALMPSFRSVVHRLSAELEVPEDELLEDFREVYRRHGTVEYPNAVQELGFWDRRHVDGEEKARVLLLVEKVFSINYRQHLHLFPHVREVLEWAHDEGITVVGLSDALERWASRRLRVLGIEKFFSGLYTWHDTPWFDDFQRPTSQITVRVQLQSTELKPNVDIVNRILFDFSLNREATYMVGDSLSKDVVAAQAAKVQDVWAQYGTRAEEKNIETLRRITPWNESEKAADKRAKSAITPTFVIDDFSELVELIGTRRPTLFD